MNGVIWVVEVQQNGNWLAYAFSETRAEARLTARWARTDSPGYPFRIRKYVRVE